MNRSFKVVWTEVAEKDLETIIAYIAEDNPENAKRILQLIRKKAASLKRNPKRGRRVPEFGEFHDVVFRELVVPPWRLVYRIVVKTVEVLAFLDGRRDLEELLYERLTRA